MKRHVMRIMLISPELLEVLNNFFYNVLSVSLILGRPPNCRPECLLNLDCPESMACVNQQCEDPCEDLCGEGAQCFVRNHVASCTCPPGYSGDPRKNGKCGKTRSPSVEYFPVGRPDGYDGEESGESNLSFSRFACEPWPCGPHRLAGEL